MDKYLKCTTTVTDIELECKAITDLIDNCDCYFWYEPSEQLGYVSFSTEEKCHTFLSTLEDIKDNIIHLYDCYSFETNT